MTTYKPRPVSENEVIRLKNGLAMLMNVQHDISGMVPGAISDGPPTSDQVRTYFLALVVETIELMNEMPAWKPWKEPKEINKDLVADEFADILAFTGLILNYLNDLGVDPHTLASAYQDKTNTNIARFSGEIPGYRIHRRTEEVD